jgi:hypothetical protein
VINQSKFAPPDFWTRTNALKKKCSDPFYRASITQKKENIGQKIGFKILGKKSNGWWHF